MDGALDQESDPLGRDLQPFVSSCFVFHFDRHAYSNPMRQ